MRRPGARRKYRATQDSTLLGDLETLIVAPRFVKQALLDEPITVYGSGTQRCSFTWVGDDVNAIMQLLQ